MTINQQLLCYKRLPNWTATTLPEMVTQKHNTKVGTWAKLTILSGSLRFYELDEQGQVTAEHLFTPETEIPFEEGELKNYYSDWELVKYNENLGHLHRLDEHGNPIALQFATMLAKKVK